MTELSKDKKALLSKIFKISKELEYFEKKPDSSSDSNFLYVKGFDIAMAVKVKLEENNLLAHYNFSSTSSIATCSMELMDTETGLSKEISVSVPTLTIKDFRYYGAQFSYLKRLCMMSMFNITVDEMDTSDTEYSKEPLITPEQLSLIQKWIDEAPNADRESLLLRHVHAPSLSEIKKRDFPQIQSYFGGK